jgi:hypothetical protein
MKVVYNMFNDVGHISFDTNLISFMFYRGKLDSTENEQKQRESKDILLPTHRSQNIGKSIHVDEYDNTNDQ